MYFKYSEKKNIKNYYNKYGFAVIRSFFKKDKIEYVKNIILNNLHKKKSSYCYYENISKSVMKLRRIERVSDELKTSRQIIENHKIKKLLNYITDKKKILFKDKLNFKYPGGAGYLPHIDGHFYWEDKNNKIRNGWHEYSDSFTNLVIPLEKVTKNNGCLYIAKKSDTKKIIGCNWKKITDNLVSNTPNIKKKDLKYFSFKPVPLNPGDILFFDWFCAHKSEKNNSKTSRMIFYSTYCNDLKKFKNVKNRYYSDKLYSKNSKSIKSLQFSQ